MLFEDYMDGMGAYLGTTGDVMAMLISVAFTMAFIAIVTYYTDVSGMVLFLLFVTLTGLWVVIEWFPAWIYLGSIIFALTYMFFTSSDIGGIGDTFRGR